MLVLDFCIVFLLLGVSSALFSKFIDFCFNEGNIFDFYYLWVITNIEPLYPKLAKIMGVCNICFNFWFSSFLFPLLLLSFKLSFNPHYFCLYFIYISFSCTMSLFLNKQN